MTDLAAGVRFARTLICRYCGTAEAVPFPFVVVLRQPGIPHPCRAFRVSGVHFATKELNSLVLHHPI